MWFPVMFCKLGAISNIFIELWEDFNGVDDDVRMVTPELPTWQDCHELWSKKRRRQMREAELAGKVMPMKLPGRVPPYDDSIDNAGGG